MIFLLILGFGLGMLILLSIVNTLYVSLQKVIERPARRKYAALQQQYGYTGAQERCPHKLTKKTYIRLALFDVPATYCKTCQKILPKKNS